MKRIIMAILLFVLDGTAMFLFRSYPSFFFPAYRIFSKKWIAFLASLSSFLKVAVWDIGAAILAIAAIATLVYTLVKKKSFLNWSANAFLIVSILVFVTVCGWMLNHYAPELSQELDLEVGEYSFDQLYESC
ncbi:MAG: DUF3810 family protein, partial [Erysipelotrichaceae bacterium]|nr:DUF3810 family protein [Erysipelotrichaceae bacterium]